MTILHWNWANWLTRHLRVFLCYSICGCHSLRNTCMQTTRSSPLLYHLLQPTLSRCRRRWLPYCRTCMIMQIVSCIFKLLIIPSPLRIGWGTWFRTGIEIFSHWQAPAWRDLYGSKMRDCFPGVKYRQWGGRERERNWDREVEKVPWVLTYIPLTVTDMILKKVVCGTFINWGRGANFIWLPVTLCQLHWVSGEWLSP